MEHFTCNAELWKESRGYVSAHFFEQGGTGYTVRCGNPVLQKCGQLYLCPEHAHSEMERLLAVAKSKESDAAMCREIAENIRQQFSF